MAHRTAQDMKKQTLFVITVLLAIFIFIGVVMTGILVLNNMLNMTQQIILGLGIALFFLLFTILQPDQKPKSDRKIPLHTDFHCGWNITDEGYPCKEQCRHCKDYQNKSPDHDNI